MTTAVHLDGLDEVIAGLRGSPKRLPCRLLYDATGAQLFDRITSLDAYYPYRSELRLLDEHLPAIAAKVGAMARVIEPGSGPGTKTRRLLRSLVRPAILIAIDVSREQLLHTSASLHDDHPDLEIQPIVADFTHAFVLPAPQRPIGRSLVFFPGSTIGNFEAMDAVRFLGRARRLAGPGAMLLLGADGTHDAAALVRAYDDEEGVTAAFDKNVLAHLNRTHAANFDLDAFDHRAVWNRQRSRVEMHLVSRCAQTIRLGGATVHLDPGEPIVTEHAYKHSVLTMRRIIAAAGWNVAEVYTAPIHPMRLWFCQDPSDGPARAEE